MEEPPPPPPPHGEKPRTKRNGGLPDGNYDIFVIPPSSAGSGFLYLPSLNTQRNSFLAGCACTAIAFFFYTIAVPVVKDWFYNTINGGGSGVLMMVLGVGVVSWALGKTQGEGIGSTPFNGKGSSVPPNTSSEPPPNTRSGRRATSSTETGPEAEHDWSPPPPPRSRSSQHKPPPREPTPPPSPPPASGFKKESGSTKDSKAESAPEPTPQSPPPKSKSSWQKTAQTPDAKSAWEKAREETRKREEERKRAAELQRRREELVKERERLREKETIERLEREWKEKKAKEDEESKKADAELRAKQSKEEADKKAQREKERREREAREALLQAAKDAREAKEALEKARREEKERKEREDKEAALKAAEDARATAAQHEAEIKAAQQRAAEMRAEDARAASAKASNLSSNSKKPPMPSARTERDDDAYSFRPYDRPRTQKSSSGSVYSDDSYAPSASTARTTPPASVRGAYSTKDPDKIIIKGVYSFNNAFMRTPISQLISGQGNVTDGLILRITTEGLFIDDDVRGIPQREWDVKAWTLKLCESIELQGHLILRASVRDQEGKKYVFILTQTEGWKVAVGLQRLRKGSQVRALGVAGMPSNEARILLESLGWT